MPTKRTVKKGLEVVTPKTLREEIARGRNKAAAEAVDEIFKKPKRRKPRRRLALDKKVERELLKRIRIPPISIEVKGGDSMIVGGTHYGDTVFAVHTHNKLEHSFHQREVADSLENLARILRNYGSARKVNGALILVMLKEDGG